MISLRSIDRVGSFLIGLSKTNNKKVNKMRKIVDQSKNETLLLGLIDCQEGQHWFLEKTKEALRDSAILHIQSNEWNERQE